MRFWVPTPGHAGLRGRGLALFFALFVAQGSGGELQPIAAVKLDPPPKEFVSVLVRGGEALLADFSEPGVVAYSLSSGRRLDRRVPPGRNRGEVVHPVAIFPAGKGFAVADSKRHALMLFHPNHKLIKEAKLGAQGKGVCSFTGPATFFSGGAVGFGGCSPQAVGGREGVYLFHASFEDSLRPILWWDPPKSPQEHLAFASAGGVLRVDRDTLVAVEPLSYTFFRFDRELRLRGSFRGSRERFREASVASLPPAGDRQAYFQWRHSQPLVLGLLAVGAGRVAAVLRLPGPDGSEYWTECYRLETSELFATQKLRAPADVAVVAALAQSGPEEFYAWLFFRQAFTKGAGSEARAYALSELCGLS